MYVGDLVRWSGFPGGDPSAKFVTGPLGIGIVVQIHENGWARYRVDVLWGDGSFGEMLYPETLEVVKEDEGG